MFNDPQSLTVNGVAQSLPRVEMSGKKSIYEKNDGSFVLTISHTNASGNRLRSMVRVDQKSIVPDPLTSVNDYETMSAYLVIDRPQAGFTATQVDHLVQALKAHLTTAAVTQLYGTES